MVYCSTTADGSYTAYASTAALSYTMTWTNAGNLYYKVRAFVTVDSSKLYGTYSADAWPEQEIVPVF